MSSREPIALFCGGDRSEHEVSLRSGRTLLGAALALGHRVHPVLIGIDGRWNLMPEVAHPSAMPAFPERVPSTVFGAVAEGSALAVAQALKDRGVELAVLGLHGRGGEDGRMQGFLEEAGIAYTGSTLRASALAIDKHRTKLVLQPAGVPVAQGLFFPCEDLGLPKAEVIRAIHARLGTSVVVKANDSGSSVGIDLVTDEAGLSRALSARHAAGQDALVEELIRGDEFTVPVMGFGARARAMPVIEIRPRRAGFFDYESKYAVGGAEEIVPAPIAPELAAALQGYAVSAHRALGCRGITRTDFLVDRERGPVALEVNTLPGFTDQSLVPKAARAMGLEVKDLVRALLDEARDASAR